VDARINPMSADSTRSRRPAGDETRQRLLDTGACLFARHGVDGVELQALQEAAGTKNQTAVRYHFGDRKGLANAIMLRHLSDVASRRKRLVEQLEPDGATRDLHRLLDALVAPMTAAFDSEVGRAQLRLVGQYYHLVGQQHDPDPAPKDGLNELTAAQVGTTLGGLIIEATASLPEMIQRLRLAGLRDQLFKLVGLRARLIDEREPPGPDHTDAVWQSNLIDQLAAGLTAPVSDHTTTLLAQVG
jgi:AcrR family transcriptional regulator